MVGNRGAEVVGYREFGTAVIFAAGPGEEARASAAEGSAAGVDTGGKIGETPMRMSCAADSAGSDRTVRAANVTAGTMAHTSVCFRRDRLHSGSRKFEEMPMAFASHASSTLSRKGIRKCRSMKAISVSVLESRFCWWNMVMLSSWMLKLLLLLTFTLTTI